MPLPSLLLTALPLLALARTGSVRIVGNLYCVGDTDLAAFLVVIPKSDILINSGSE